MSKPAKKRISILGSTGSIGTQALEVVRRFRDRFEVVALAAGRNAELLRAQAHEFRPALLSIGDPRRAGELEHVAREIGADLTAGPEGLERAATAGEPDLVLLATVGFAGVAPTLAAAEAGIDIALANKEALVCAGDLIIERALQSGSRLIPVDSEHNAIFQCLGCREERDVRRILLTASGGPFRTRPREDLSHVSADDVLAHPCWDMGAKISVDSATMMNKGFEVLEAMWLFAQPAERIEVVVHPQSIVHSMVEFADGSVIAQLGPTDMRLPIQYALFHPESEASPCAPLDLAAVGRLDFEEPDPERFPLLGLAYEAARNGSRQATALNAINEEAVGSFLDRKMGFLEMQELIIDAFRQAQGIYPPSEERATLAQLIEIDRRARQLTRDLWIKSSGP